MNTRVQEANKDTRLSEFKACLTLRHTPKLGPVTWKRLLEHFGSACTALQARSSWVEQGLTSVEQMKNCRDGMEKVEKESALVLRRQDGFILYSDSDYPTFLREISTPPILLYFLGRRELLRAPAVAVVGSRSCSSYALRQAARICQELSASGITLVSGLACGIDRQAHLSGLAEIGSSIAVLGTGLDLVYPAMNRDVWEMLYHSGLILSEFPPGTKPEGSNFPVRNRIVSGLSLGVLVVQAALKSGSMVTARLALEQNREVFAVPGPADQKQFMGCHHLIKQGAVLTQSAEDILFELAPQLERFSQPVLRKPSTGRKGNFSDLNAKQIQVVKCLQDEESRHIDSLLRELGWATQELSSVLLDLELKGYVQCLPGMRYTLAAC